MLRIGLVCLFVLCRADEIIHLPGLDFKVNFKHYSGFFNVSHTHRLHYWFVESQNTPGEDPLIFWFNGGPGCSSLDGLLNEMGPYLVNSDGKTLRRNPYSWNKLASVVYIESPAGVGYSYSTDGNITTSDEQTSVENYEAVKQFFKTFPQFRNHCTYMMGESYGGVYVPTLTARIVDGQKDFPINLKGMAVGNGYVNEKLNTNAAIRFAYGHGLVDEKTWNTMERECCKGCTDTCDFTKVSEHCTSMVNGMFKFIRNGGLNPYDLYRDCNSDPSINGKRMIHLLKGLAPDLYRPLIEMQKKNESYMSVFRANEPLYGGLPCINDSNLISYMNNCNVRAALNISVNLPKWDTCSEQVHDVYQQQYGDMAPFVKNIVDANVRVLLYYGDTDMVCNFMMGQQFSHQLGLKRKLGKTPWKFGNQIAGFKTRFDGLTFLTVKGAGHMVPLWKAPQMYYVIQQFLLNHPI